VNIVELLAKFRPFFRDLSTWAAWIAALKAIFGLSMDGAEVEVYRRHTGRQAPPTVQSREGWFVVGRRGGKSRVAALVVVFLAFCRDYRDILAPGEQGTVMVVAADRRQARTVFRYICAFIEGVPTSIPLRSVACAATASSRRCSTRWRTGAPRSPRIRTSRS
jgi:hypothetical protein